MDVQPPPIESYTNTMLSPTYRGSEPTPVRAIPEPLPQPFNGRGKGTQDNNQQKNANQHEGDPFLLRLLAHVAAATPCLPSKTSTTNSIKNVSKPQSVADEDEDIFYTPPLCDEPNVP